LYYYSSIVNSVAGETSTADQAGIGSVMGKGFGSIIGPDGMAFAGGYAGGYGVGYGGGNIIGGSFLSAFNGASGNVIGGGRVGNFIGGTGTFVPGQNSELLTQQAKGGEVTGPSGSTGGEGGAKASDRVI
jgi:hypothetical protein